MRIHITGASGSGTSTLGVALAAELGGVHFEADTYYWLPTSPPFAHKRAAPERLSLLLADLASTAISILAGSVVGWGAELEDSFDLIVFLYVDAEVRVERLRSRELERLGHADEAFLAWAAQYAEGPPEGRSLIRHRSWLAARTCPRSSNCAAISRSANAWPQYRAREASDRSCAPGPTAPGRFIEPIPPRTVDRRET